MSYSQIQVVEEPFGEIQLGDSNETVKRFSLTNHHGGQVQLMTYGAAITSLKVPDRAGNLRDVVLGFDDIQGTRKRFFSARLFAARVLRMRRVPRVTWQT